MKYKQLLRQIDDLVETDEAFELTDGHALSKKPYTQEEAERMAHLLSMVYRYAHQITCVACRSSDQAIKIGDGVV